jgi:NAD(P)-dependent dehydrogenase (short-subunit alcohol dehydrogenase family)
VRRARLPPEEDPVAAAQARTARTGDELLGRVACVTGGTRGTGAATCRSPASPGAEVAAGRSGDQQAAAVSCASCEDVDGASPDRHATVHGTFSLPRAAPEHETLAREATVQLRRAGPAGGVGVTVDRGPDV